MNSHFFKRIFIIASCLVFTPFISFDAQATTVWELSDSSITSKATEIVHGTITAVESFQYDAVILTKVTLRVETWLKPAQNTQKEFVFYTRGGKLSEIAQIVPGEMVPKPGMEVVVFLERIPRYNHVPMLLGLQQGAYYVEDIESRVDQKRRIVQNLKGLNIHPADHPGSESFKQSQTLDELLDKIRKELQNEAKP